MPLIDFFFDQVFVDFLQLRAKLLDPPGSSLDPSYLLYKFFVDNFMKPTSDAARDKLLNDFNHSTVPWGPANFAPQAVTPRQMRFWRMQWFEEKEKKAVLSLPPTEGESEWAKLNRQMSYHPDPWRYWYWEWLDEQEKEKERCAAEGKVYVDPFKPLPELEPPRGEFYFKTKDTLGQRYLYTRPSHPIYKRARLMYLRKHPDENCLRHYLTPSELKATRGLEPGPLSQMKKVSREKIESFKRRLESWRKNSDAALLSSQSVLEVEAAAATVEDMMPLAQGEGAEEEIMIEGENVEEKVDEEWPSIPGEIVENENDVKQEEVDDEWPSSQEEEFALEEDVVKNDQDEHHDEWPSIQEEEYAQEELVRSAEEEQTQEEEDVERPSDVDAENAQQSVQRPLVQEAEIFEEVDAGKRKNKSWWRRPSSLLNKSLLVSAFLILALLCGLCIYSSSSVTYHNNGAALSLKIRMSLPHPSWFRVGKLIPRVASSSVHALIQSCRLPYRFKYMADCHYDGCLIPT